MELVTRKRSVKIIVVLLILVTILAQISPVFAATKKKTTSKVVAPPKIMIQVKNPAPKTLKNNLEATYRNLNLGNLSQGSSGDKARKLNQVLIRQGFLVFRKGAAIVPYKNIPINEIPNTFSYETYRALLYMQQALGIANTDGKYGFETESTYNRKYHSNGVLKSIVTYTGVSSKKFKLYIQQNYFGPYDTDNVSISGCGPTSVAIILSAYGNANGKAATPNTIAKFLGGKGTATDSTVLKRALKAYGVDSIWTYDPTKESIITQLTKNKKPLIISVDSSQSQLFTKKGHLMTLLNIKKSGTSYQVYVGNPSDQSRGLSGWYDIDIVYNCCKNKYVGYIGVTSIPN